MKFIQISETEWINSESIISYEVLPGDIAQVELSSGRTLRMGHQKLLGLLDGRRKPKEKEEPAPKKRTTKK